MSLQVWLPLNGDLHNQGLSNVTLINNGTSNIDDNGKIGKCYLFNGNNYFQSNETFLNNMISCSLSCWVKDTYTGTSWMRIFGIGEHTRAHLDVNGSGLVRFFVSKDGSTGTYWGPIGKTNIKDSKWHHICGTFNNNFCKIYIDGKCETTVTTNTLPTQTGGKLYLGHIKDGIKLTGALNDVRVYDHALSAKEVEEISKGLVLHYKLAGSTINLNTTNPNILTGTYYNSYKSGLTAGTTATNATGKWTSGSGGNGTFSVTYDETCPVGVLSWNVLNNTSGNRDFQQGNQPYVSGQKYTTSFWAKGNGNCLYRSWNTTDGKAMFSKTWTLTSTWTYYTYTFTASAEMETDSCTFHLGVSGNANINICGMKMELGTVATPWCPAESEIESLGFDQDIVYDSSGYNNNGIIINSPNILTSSPRYNCTTEFDENTDSVQISSYLSNGQTLNEITVSCWFKTNTLNSTAPNIFSLGSNAFLRCRLANATSIWSYYRVVSTQKASTYSCKNLLDNTWHLLTFTFLNGIEKVYLDGEQIGSTDQSSTGTYLTCASTSWHLAGYSANSENFIGALSDFRIYTTALTAEQIKELYNTSATIDKDGNIYAREFDTINTTSNPNITKTGIMKPVNIIQERDEQLASIEKNNNILGGHFYEY